MDLIVQHQTQKTQIINRQLHGKRFYLAVSFKARARAHREPLETITMSAFKPRLQKKKFQGIGGIKTSYFPQQSPFIAATNPSLLYTGAVSKNACILRKVTNRFTVGI